MEPNKPLSDGTREAERASEINGLIVPLSLFVCVPLLDPLQQTEEAGDKLSAGLLNRPNQSPESGTQNKTRKSRSPSRPTFSFYIS